MKTYLKYLLASTVLVCAAIACSEVSNGYISDTIIYYTNPIPVSAGVTTYSITPNLGSSTTPVEFEIVDVKDSLGNSTDELTKLRDLYVWTSPYNSLTDTTLAIINSKRKISESDYTMKLLKNSGQFLFTEATAECIPGTYSISLKMSNSAGVKTYNDVVKVRLEKTQWKKVAAGWNLAHISNGSGGWMPVEGTIECVNNPDGPNKIHIKVCDQNGNAFDWSAGEIVTRGDRPSLELGTPWAKPVYTSTEAVYEYPFTPFPFGGITNSEGTITTEYWYYRILSKHASVDGYTPKEYNINLTYGFYLYATGEWFVTIKYPGLNRVS